MANESIALISKSYLDRNTVTSSTQLNEVTQVGKYADAKAIIDAIKEGKGVKFVENANNGSDYFMDIDTVYDFIRFCKREDRPLFDSDDENLYVFRCLDGTMYPCVSNEPSYDSLIDPNRLIKKKEKKEKIVIGRHFPMTAKEGYFYKTSKNGASGVWVKLKIHSGWTLEINFNSQNTSIVIPCYDDDYRDYSQGSANQHYLSHHNTKIIDDIDIEEEVVNDTIIKKRYILDNRASETLSFTVFFENIGGGDFIGVSDENRFFTIDTENCYMVMNFFIQDHEQDEKGTVSLLSKSQITTFESTCPYLQIDNGLRPFYDASEDPNMILYKDSFVPYGPNTFLMKLGGLSLKIHDFFSQETRLYRSFSRQFLLYYRKRQSRSHVRFPYNSYLKLKIIENLLYINVTKNSSANLRITFFAPNGNGSSVENTIEIVSPFIDKKIHVIDLEEIYGEQYKNIDVSNIEIQYLNNSVTNIKTNGRRYLTRFKKLKSNRHRISGFHREKKCYPTLIYPKKRGIKSKQGFILLYNERFYLT